MSRQTTLLDIPSVISSPGLPKGKPQLFRRVVHSIKKAMAGRAENPGLLWPDERGACAARSKPFVSRFVRDLCYSIFTAGFTFSWGVRVQMVEAAVLTIGWQLRSCARAVDGFHLRSSLVECPGGLRVTCSPALIGAKPFVVLSRLDGEPLPAHPAFMPILSRLARVSLPPVKLALTGAVFSVDMRCGHRDAALHAFGRQVL